jgi:hypothetical protein
MHNAVNIAFSNDRVTAIFSWSQNVRYFTAIQNADYITDFGVLGDETKPPTSSATK